ncbi:MAG: 30S ribosomal protein S1 [Gammaproteobacteria bacterium]|jgi:small subunit ribosomal protein S1|nr:30S ribosomal protein S1 [Gammaproteobacteria bacterium]
MSESFAELLEESLAQSQLTPGSIIKAEVVSVGPEMVVVRAGLKSEGVIPVEQFRGPDGTVEVQPGDVVDVALDAIEDGMGETRLSHERAKRLRAWAELEAAFRDGAVVTGVINGKVKGGFTADLNGVRAFLPGSLVDVRPVRDATFLEGRPLQFKIIKFDQKRNNVVVSRRAVVEAEGGAEREALSSQIVEGAILKGVVKNLTDYGAFVDLGGVDGLLHITDMAWRRVRNPSEVVSVGQELDVKVLRYDRERNRVSLGLKQLGEDPWIDIARRHPVGSRTFGRVTNVTEYGCFVEIEPGVEGLVHLSEMDWTTRNINPSKVVHIGDEIEVMVLEIDEERRRISLGMKQCTSNPWLDFANNHAKGERISGKIKSITDFGIFVGLEGGIDGLVHISDISWEKPGEEVIRNYKKGDEIEAVLLGVDAERERISLGVKQLEKDPITAFMNQHGKGATVKGTIKAVDARGADVDLGDGVDGYIRASDISRDRVEDARTILHVGDPLEALVVGADRKRHAISLSVRALEAREEAQALDALAGRNGGGEGGTTLGDMMKSLMVNREADADDSEDTRE